MKSKTPRNSKSSSRKAAFPADVPFTSEVRISEEVEYASLAVGHQPTMELSPEDQALFQAFQSNLLSLISHELKTPLMGVLNALSLLSEDIDGQNESPIPMGELVAMAKQNADRLNRALTSLLDLAALESGQFHARLREIDLVRLVRHRCEANLPLMSSKKLSVDIMHVHESHDSKSAAALSVDELPPVLADPVKLGRAVDLCFQAIVPRAEEGTVINVRISSTGVDLQFFLQGGQEKVWESIWAQSLAGYEGGVTSPNSAFASTIQSEQSFLTRKEEGLGNEFLLIHELIRLHRGKFECQQLGRQVSLRLTLPKLSSEDSLKAVITARAGQVSPEQGAMSSMALGLIRVPAKSTVDAFRAEVRRHLFRSSDAVYALPDSDEVAIVLDDCKPEHVPQLFKRLADSLKITLKSGVATCPGDGTDASILIQLARKRMGESRG